MYYDVFVKDRLSDNVVQIGSLLQLFEVRALVLALDKANACDVEVFWKEITKL